MRQENFYRPDVKINWSLPLAKCLRIPFSPVGYSGIAQTDFFSGGVIDIGSKLSVHVRSPRGLSVMGMAALQPRFQNDIEWGFSNSFNFTETGFEQHFRQAALSGLCSQSQANLL